MVDLTLSGNREYRKTCGHFLYPKRCRSKKTLRSGVESPVALGEVSVTVHGRQQRLLMVQETNRKSCTPTPTLWILNDSNSLLKHVSAIQACARTRTHTEEKPKVMFALRLLSFWLSKPEPKHHRLLHHLYVCRHFSSGMYIWLQASARPLQVDMTHLHIAQTTLHFCTCPKLCAHSASDFHCNLIFHCIFNSARSQTICMCAHGPISQRLHGERSFGRRND